MIEPVSVDATQERTQIVETAFGASNRRRLLDEYFGSLGEPVSATSAWRHVYQLLLWIDRTTGLAHCYESDKCQPGKPWYSRALAFHSWLADALRVNPKQVATAIDWLFQKAAAELAIEAAARSKSLAEGASKQRKPYDGLGFPRPGDDPELVSTIKALLQKHLHSEPSPDEWLLLVQRVRQYLSLDNKRKNLLGEGFEDVLGQVIRRSLTGAAAPKVAVRQALGEIPGFAKERSGDKPHKVDVSIVQPGMRTLVTAKWSVRADREKQFTTDYNEYVRAESSRRPFAYVFVTNEFDPARLARACENLAGKDHLFTHVVHMNTDALRATYRRLNGTVESRDQDSTIRRVLGHIETGRLLSLEGWLTSLSA